jgi:hypothetical protein
VRESGATGGRFGRALARLDPEAFARFVAAAHVARPDVDEVRLDGGCLVVHGREERRLRLVADRGPLRGTGPVGPANGPVDAVVTQVPGSGDRTAVAHDARLLGPADLRDLVCYGLAREDAGRLLDDHLGMDRETALADGSGRRPVAVAAAAVAALALVAGVLGTAVAGPGAPAGPATSTPDGSTPVTERGTAAGLPPGLSPAGVADPAALARAHEAAIDGRRYAFSVEARNVPALSGPGYWRELEASAVVAGPRTYRASLGGVRVAERGTWWRLSRIYADGDRLYERRFGAHAPVHDVRPAPPDGPEMDRGTEHARRYLAVRSAPGGNVTPAEVGGEWGHRVAVGRAPPGVDGDSYRATARVTESGRITSLDVVYVRPDGERATLTVRYEPTDERVRPPDWLDEVRRTGGENETGAGDGATVAGD